VVGRGKLRFTKPLHYHCANPADGRLGAQYQKSSFAAKVDPDGRSGNHGTAPDADQARDQDHVA
jgi:hypothetical protein